MIQFTLKCSDDHRFDSWFQSTDAFDKLMASDMITCAVCGSVEVEKAVMAPRVRASRSQSEETAPDELSTPPNPAEQSIAALKKQVEENSEYVGLNFAAQARDMYEGTTPTRAIYGEAGPEEARKLIDEGVPVTPLPFIPRRKSN